MLFVSPKTLWSVRGSRDTRLTVSHGASHQVLCDTPQLKNWFDALDHGKSNVQVFVSFGSYNVLRCGIHVVCNLHQTQETVFHLISKHQEDTVKPVLSRCHIKRTPFIKRTVLKVPQFISSLINFTVNNTSIKRTPCIKRHYSIPQGFPLNTSLTVVKNITCSRVFLMKFEVFGNRMKHFQCSR